MTDSLLPMPVVEVPSAVRLNEQSVRKLRMGYPWVFRSEVINAKAAENIPPGTMPLSPAKFHDALSTFS